MEQKESKGSISAQAKNQPKKSKSKQTTVKNLSNQIKSNQIKQSKQEKSHESKIICIAGTKQKKGETQA